MLVVHSVIEKQAKEGFTCSLAGSSGQECCDAVSRFLTVAPSMYNIMGNNGVVIIMKDQAF